MKKKKHARNPSDSENKANAVAESSAEAVAESKQQPAAANSGTEADGKDDFAQAVSTLADATGIISVIPPKEENKDGKKENVKKEKAPKSQ